jgi:hypothetical protein
MMEREGSIVNVRGHYVGEKKPAALFFKPGGITPVSVRDQEIG